MSKIQSFINVFEILLNTRSCAALRAADLGFSGYDAFQAGRAGISKKSTNAGSLLTWEGGGAGISKNVTNAGSQLTFWMFRLPNVASVGPESRQCLITLSTLSSFIIVNIVNRLNSVEIINFVNIASTSASILSIFDMFCWKLKSPFTWPKLVDVYQPFFEPPWAPCYGIH